jgi:hypothetical protein
LAFAAAAVLETVDADAMGGIARIANLMRVCAGGAGFLLMVRCGLRWVARLTYPEPSGMPDNLPTEYVAGMTGYYAERRYEYAMFRVLGGGDLAGLACVLGLVVFALRGFSGPGLCLWLPSPATIHPLVQGDTSAY